MTDFPYRSKEYIEGYKDGFKDCSEYHNVHNIFDDEQEDLITYNLKKFFAKLKLIK
jgi:hypothetical protein